MASPSMAAVPRSRSLFSAGNSVALAVARRAIDAGHGTDGLSRPTATLTG